MPTDVIDAKPNTDAQVTNADVKPSDTALGTTKSQTQEQVTPPAVPEKDSTDTKTPEAAKADAAKAEAEKKASEGAPEKYNDFKVSENVKLDPESLTEAQAVFKDLNLSQDKAQKVMDLAVKHAEKIQVQQAQALEKAGEAWRKEIETDKELGGLNFKKSNEAAIRFRDKFTSPEEREALKPIFNSGWGNFPALWKIFVRAGLAIGEDQVVDGGLSKPEESAAKIMFPTMK